MAKEHYDRTIFFNEVRPIFGKLFQEMVDGMNLLLDTWEPTPFYDRRCLAYILATTKAETGNMTPREEVGKGKGHEYGRPDPQTGKAYYGRGFVQLTWKENYVRATKHINSRDLLTRKVDLVNRPEQALDPDVAAVIIIYGMEEGWFTGKSTSDYFTKDKTDWVNARRVVNVLDRADEIAGYAKAFHAALSKAATEAEPEQPPEIPDPPAQDTGRDPTLAALIEQIKSRTGASKVLLDI